MSSSLHLLGEDYSDAQSREAFRRIEDTIRQFTVHSRENVVLARNPFVIAEDHFVVLWSHGAGLVIMYPQGGRIYGGVEGYWTYSQNLEHAVRETRLENPVQELRKRRELLLRFLSAAAKPAYAIPEGDDASSDRPIGEFSHCTKAIALFITPGSSLDVREALVDPTFTALTLDSALARTMFHLPSLLKQIEWEGQCFSAQTIALLARGLNEEIEKNALIRTKTLAQDPPGVRLRRSLAAPSRRRKLVIVIPVLIATLALLFLLLRKTGPEPVSDPAPPDTGATTQPVKPSSNSTIIIRMDEEVQIFVSRYEYATRRDFDHALARGEGVRKLPAKSHQITMDSSALATGVYGYFKVGNHWRKGKLLQTFQVRDTIFVDNFLPPLK